MAVTATVQPGPLSQFSAVLRSEWCKLRSVRSAVWMLVAAVVFNFVVAAVLGIVLPGHLSAQSKETIDPVQVSLGGLHLSQIAIGMLGVLVISSEYTTGMIRATLTAVPQRRLMLTAKALVLGAAALVTGLVASFAAFLVFQAFLPAGEPMRATLADPGVLRAVVGGGLYLAVLALLGFGLGAVIRSGAGAVAAVFGLLFVPTLLAALLPDSWRGTVGPYLPMNAAEAVYITHPQSGTLGPWAGFGVFCGYAAAVLLASFILITRRDA